MAALVHRRALGTGLIAAALLSACVTNPYVERSTLQNEPAAKIRLPAVTELGRVGHDRELTFEGPLPAVDGYVFGADVAREDLFRYYDAELRRLGWTQDLYGIYRTTVETDIWGWCKPRMTFRLAIKDQSRAYDLSFYKGRTFKIVFEANLQGRNAEVRCPDFR